MQNTLFTNHAVCAGCMDVRASTYVRYDRQTHCGTVLLNLVSFELHHASPRLLSSAGAFLNE